ncbi:MAG: type II toxin-antitoxin system VapC family toxin [Nitrososphaera sp.]|uniref:type II toxin-antitoxin system VapC family toxin n=1 Tax=Nitrososphaera sp. TaxID=1971748 RepID=UPI003D6EAA22
MACLDTDFMVGLERGVLQAFAKLESLESEGEAVFITAVTVAELYHGAYRAKNKEQAVTNADKSLLKFNVLDLDARSARLWGELSYKLKSNSIGDLDLFIACISLSHGQKLVTRNAGHFERVPDLKVESW